MPASTPPLDDCLRLLCGERDEQKLAGLLIAANVCRAGDAATVTDVYRAVGPRFLRRLLNTGLGKVEGGKEEEREAYLRLAVTVLAGLARVPEVAADEGVVSTVPLIAEVVSKSSDLTITEECFELLSLIAIASEDGAYKFCEPGVMDMLFLQMSSFPDGSKCLELATHLMQLLVHKLRVDNMSVERLQGMTSMVTSLARLFAVLHTAVKFESLHMLTTLLSQKESPLHGALRSMPSAIWESHIRVGITAVLQNHVVSSEKLQVLLLAECMMSILGENWLSEDYKIPDNQNAMPIDKFVLLVLESARVEVAVLLNELAYLKYESSKNSQTDYAISQKQRNLAILFSLIERIIKMISNASSGEGRPPLEEIMASRIQAELLLLEDDMKALEEMYPQGEQAEATWALTVLGYIGKFIFGVVGVIQFCATAFAYYSQATAAQEIFGHTLQSLRGIKYLYKYNVFQYGFVALAILTLFYYAIFGWRKRKPTGRFQLSN